jgi:hypothetical protein
MQSTEPSSERFDTILRERPGLDRSCRSAEKNITWWSYRTSARPRLSARQLHCVGTQNKILDEEAYQIIKDTMKLIRLSTIFRRRTRLSSREAQDCFQRQLLDSPQACR